MNERIRQLALQAGMVKILTQHAHEYGAGTFEDTEYPELEKFAELIVKECARLNRLQSYELMGVITDVEEGDGFDDVCLNTVKRVAEHLANDLKEHWGVEE
jgi:hypothetical protein